MNIERLFNVYKGASITPLGIWNNNNYTETSLKVKYATEDNCGISCYNNKNITQIHYTYRQTL